MVTYSMLFWLSAGVLTIGVGLILYSIFGGLYGLGVMIYERMPGRKIAHRMKNIGLVEETFDRQSLITPLVAAERQRADFPMWITFVLAGFCLIAYFYTNSMLVFGLIVLYILARMWISAYYKRLEKKDVLLFLLDLRTKLTLRGSLLNALEEVSNDKRTVLARIFRIYLDAGFQGNGLQLMKKVAQDTKLPFLDDIVARAEASASGKLSLDDALRQAIEIVQEEIDVSAREQLQSIPSRLIIIVFPTLLGPGLVILLYPVVANLLTSMRGMGGGGF